MIAYFCFACFFVEINTLVVVRVNLVARQSLILSIRQFPDIIVPDTTETITNLGSISRTQIASDSVAQQMKIVAEAFQSVTKTPKYAITVGTDTLVVRHVTVANAIHTVTSRRECVRRN